MNKEKIKVAIVGTGRISDLHAIEYMQNPNAEIVALCDSNIDLAKNRAKKWGCSDSTKIVDELMYLYSSAKEAKPIIAVTHTSYSVASSSIYAL